MVRGIHLRAENQQIIHQVFHRHTRAWRFSDSCLEHGFTLTIAFELEHDACFGAFDDHGIALDCQTCRTFGDIPSINLFALYFVNDKEFVVCSIKQVRVPV